MRQVKKDATNISVELYIVDSGDGTPETGVVFNTSGIDLNYRRDGAVVVSITEADLTTPALTDAHEDGGFLEIANGRYRLDVPDAAFATGVSQVTIGGTVTGMVVLPVTIQLVDFDPDDAVRLGLTSLPNAAADAAGGLVISDAGGLDVDVKLANTNEVTIARMAALTDWIDGGRLDLLLDAIPTTAMRGTDSAATATSLTTLTTTVGAAGAGLTEAGGTGDHLTAMPWNAAWDAEVESEVNDAIDTAISELCVAAPTATPTIRTALMLLYMSLRNKSVTQTSGTDALEVYNNAGAIIAKKLLTDDGSDYTAAEMVSG